jgi:putative NADH-flavin reductase
VAPAAYKAEALAHADALEALRAFDDVGEWIYLSPAPLIESGQRTGTSTLGTTHWTETPVSAERLRRRTPR